MYTPIVTESHLLELWYQLDLDRDRQYGSALSATLVFARAQALHRLANDEIGVTTDYDNGVW